MPDSQGSPKPEELLRLLLDQGKDYALILFDARGRIVAWLAGAEMVFGYPADEMLGQPASHLFTPEDLGLGLADHEFEVARKDGRAEDDRWHVRKDGSRIWGNGVLMALRDDAGEIVGFGKVLQDRTDVKARIDALANANRRKDVFLGTLAHELRNQLGPIQNAAQVFTLTRGGDAAQQAAADIIGRQVGYFTRLVDDLLDVSRVTAGKVRLRLERVRLNDVLARATESCRPDAERRRHDFQVLVPAAPISLDADPVRLQQVFVNLLANAVKYTPEGGRVWLKATVEGDEAVVRVEDTGVGNSGETLPRLFELFTQEELSVSRSEGGLGLGLSLVKELVALHGGTVQVRSEGKGKGSEFTLRLPLKQPTAAEHASSS
jgi:PAS domain S-box-containing protein